MKFVFQLWHCMVLWLVLRFEIWQICCEHAVNSKFFTGIMVMWLYWLVFLKNKMHFIKWQFLKPWLRGSMCHRHRTKWHCHRSKLFPYPHRIQKFHNISNSSSFLLVSSLFSSALRTVGQSTPVLWQTLKAFKNVFYLIRWPPGQLFFFCFFFRNTFHLMI